MASGESRRSVAAWIVFVVVLGAIFLGAGACTSAREAPRPTEDGGVRNPRASSGAGAPWTETPSGFGTVSSGTRLRVGRDGAIHVGDGIEFRPVDASIATLEGDRVSVRGTGSTGEFAIAPGGVERTWSFASMPEGSDDLEVRLHVRGGKLLREDGEGVHFVSDSADPAPTARRERAVVGHGTWIDARGVRTAVKARHEDGDVVFRVARSTVASSRFPAVLDPVIGPDLTLGGPATAPYYGDHGMADVAWNGTNYLVVWLAVRGSLPAGLMVQTFDAAGVATSAPQQLQASGSVGTLVQIRVISSGTNFAVATLSRAGVSSYLATWALQGNGNSVNGSSLASIYIGSDVTGIDMAASSTEVFVVWDTPTTAPGISGRRYVASTMSPYSTTTETLAAGTVGNTKRPRISWNGTHFLVVWTRTFGTNDDIEGVRYLPGTGVVGTNPIAISKRAEGEVDPVVASNGTQWLVGWRVTGATPRVKTARVSAAGLVLDTVPVVHGTSPVVGSTSLVWTGTNYVLGFADSTGPSGTNVSAFRITAGGATVGTSPARFGTTTVGTDPFALAAGPAHVFATWTTGTPGSRGVTGRRMAIDGTFPEAQGTLLTQGAVSRNFPAVAWNGSRYLVAWNETRTFSGNILWVAAVAPDGHAGDPTGIPISALMGGIADVHVTATANGFFLAWSNRTNGIGVVEGTYVDVVGDVVSALPVFSIDTTSTVLLSSVATNGSSELATSYSYNQPAVHTHEITRNGSVVTVGARTLVARGFLAAGLSTTPSAVWTGTHYQMVWADARASDDKSVLFGIRVDGHGVPIDVIGRPLTTVEGYDFVPSLAWDGQKAFATFRMNPVRYGQTQVMAIHVEADGSPTEATPVLVAGLAPGFASFPPATVWMNDDATFLFVDSKTTQTSPGAYDNALLTTWLDRSGRRLDTTAQRVNPEVSHDLYPALAAGPPGEALLVHAKSGATFDAYAGFLALRLVTSGSPIGAACSAHEDCRLRNCVDGYCCNEACGDACRTCSATPGTCTAVTSGTDPPTCSGTSSCGPTGTCKANDGRACSEDAECLSGHCADGVCCDTACQGSCDACDLAGSVGVCSVVPAGRPGTPDCFPATCDGTRPNCPGNCTTDADCAADGFCSKNGLCEIRRSNGQTCNDNACQIPGCRQCTSGHCVDGYCCDGACSGACDSCSKVPGTCQRASRGERGNPSCSPFVCTGTSDACPTRCTDSTECVNGARCDVATRTCVARLRVGSACDAPDVCESGACVDGVCCDRACNGQCEACDVPGAEGRCSAISGTPHGLRSPCSRGNATCEQRVCDGTKSASTCEGFVGTEVQCAEATCQDGVESFAASCNGAGACGVGDTSSRRKPCSPFACADARQCRTDCANDGHCVAGYRCDVASKTCVTGSTCVDAHVLVSVEGARQDCAPYGCVAGACVTSCTEVANCAEGFVCDSRGACIVPEASPKDVEGGCGCRVVRARSDRRSALALLVVVAVVAGRRRPRARWRSRRPSSAWGMLACALSVTISALAVACGTVDVPVPIDGGPVAESPRASILRGITVSAPTALDGPLESRESGPQGLPSAASDGTNAYVVWLDFTDYVPVVEGRLVALDGTPVPKTRRVFGTGFGAQYQAGTAAVAWTGQHYLVTWVSSVSSPQYAIRIVGQRISSAGVPLDPQPQVLALVDTECLGLSAASAGGNTFVAWGKPYVAQAWGMAVGPTMSVLLAPTRLDVGSNYERKPQVASNGSSFLVVWDAAASAGGTGRILGRRVTSAGALVGTASFVVGTHAQRSYERSAVASNGTDFLVSYDTSNPYKRYVARVTASGSVLDPDGVPLPGSLYVSAQRYGIGYDGTRYVVPGFDASGGRYALGYVRVSATGTPDAALTVLETATSGLAPPTMFVVGGGGRGLVVRDATTAFDDVTAYPYATDGVPVGGSLRVNDVVGIQRAPSVAWSGSHGALAWTERRGSTDSLVLHRFAADTTSTESAGPVELATGSGIGVAGITTGFGVAWSTPGTSETTLRRAIVPETGTVDVGNAPSSDVGVTVASVSGGSRFAVGLFGSTTFSAGPDMALFDVSANGLSPARYDSFRVNSGFGNAPRSVSVASTSFGLAVAWSDNRNGAYQVHTGRFDGAITPKDTIRLVTTATYADPRAAIASDGTDSLVVWNTGDTPRRVLFARVARDGTPKDSPPLVLATDVGVVERPAVAWVPSVPGYLVVWQRGGANPALVGAVLGVDGVRKDPSDVPLVTDAVAAAEPALAPSEGSKVLLGYVVDDDRDVPAARRVRVRTVDLGIALGAACASDAECAGRTCVDGVCCETRCDGACRTCSATPGTCTVVNGADDPDTCAGTTTCNATGACLSRNGETCTRGGTCASDVCSDGACCDRACDAPCDSCILPGSVGRCTPRPRGSASEAAACGGYACDGILGTCASRCTSDVDCASGHFCSSRKQCEPRRGPAQSCGPADCNEAGCRECTTDHCVDGVCCDTACDGACDSCALVPGTCSVVDRGAPGSPSCYPGVCTGSSPSCGTTCTVSLDCADDAVCEGGVCKGTRPIATACARGEECASGFCVDGVCCNRACNGQCEACDATGSVGNCSPISGDPHGNRPSCGGGGGGVCARATCDGTKSASSCSAYPGPEVECAPAACSAGTMTFAIACDGQGRCGDGAVRKKACAPYDCDGTVCRTSCRSDADCRGGSACDVASGKCVSTSTCEGTLVVAATGERTDCFPNVCADGACGTQCASIDQCASGAFCDERGKCQPNVLPPPRTNSGCGCRVVPTPSPHPAWSVPGLVLVSILGRRRARRRPSP